MRRRRRFLASAVFVGLLLAGSGASAAFLPGDVNDDGTWDAIDVLLVARHLRGESLLTGDALEAADIAPFDQYWAAPDNVVDAADLLILTRVVRGEIVLPHVPDSQELDTPVVSTGEVVAWVGDGAALQVLGQITIEDGGTLVLWPGASLEFEPSAGAEVRVQGTLAVRGTPAEPAVFEAAGGQLWEGILVGPSADPGALVISYAEVLGARDGIDVLAGSTAEISFVTVDGRRESSKGDTALRLDSAAAVVVSDSSLLGAVEGLSVSQSSPLVQRTHIEFNTFGVRIGGSGSAPSIQDGWIRDNETIGIHVATGPGAAVVTGNIIERNGGVNYRAVLASSVPADYVLNAEDNYWGTDSPATIAARILDRADSIPTLEEGQFELASPQVDFVPYRTSLGATTDVGELGGKILMGAVEPGTVLASTDSPLYEIPWVLAVPEGETLTIRTTGPGEGPVTLAFGDYSGSFPVGRELSIMGRLDVQGADGKRVLFTSRQAADGDPSDAQPGDWFGLRIRPPDAAPNSPLAASSLSYADILYAYRAIEAVGDSDESNTAADLVADELEVSEFESAGIYLKDNGSGSTLSTLSISNDGTGTGLVLRGSSPLLEDSDIFATNVGIDAGDGTPPLPATGSGIFNFPGEPSNPVLNGNSLYANTAHNLVVSNTALPPVVINARENYWGVDNPASQAEIAATIDTRITNVDFSDYRPTLGGSPVSAEWFIHPVTNVAHSAAHFNPAIESVDVSFDVLVSGPFVQGDVRVEFYREDDDALATLIACIEPTPPVGAGPWVATWDGTKTDAACASSLQEAAEEAYSYAVKVFPGPGELTFSPARADQGDWNSAANAPGLTKSQPFAPFENDFYGLMLEIRNEPGRVTATVAEGSGIPDEPPDPGSVVRTLLDEEPFWVDPPENPGDPARAEFPVYFDGRNDSGELLAPGTFQIFFDVPKPLKEYAVIVSGNVPQAAGPHSAPAPGLPPEVEVKSNPYLMQFSYDQISSFEFCVDHDSYVTVSLLKPGCSDVASTACVVDVPIRQWDEEEQKPIEEMIFTAASDCGAASPDTTEVNWSGHSSSDANRLLGSDPNAIEGNYTFAIEARRKDQTDLSSLYRGVIRVLE